MTIEKEKIHEDFSRDVFWTRVRFISDDARKKTNWLVCVSQEYISCSPDIKEFDGDVSRWLSHIIESGVKSNEEKIFDKPINFLIYTTTEEGRINAQEFLETKINI